jgi:hypothetical protein
LFLAQIRLFVPGTNPTFCSWYKSSFLFLVQIRLFVPGTNPA